MWYHCTNPACAHALAREVNFCPYCGMPQHAGAKSPMRPAPPVDTPTAVPEPVRVPEVVAPTARPAPFVAPPVTSPPPAPTPPPARPAPVPAAPPQREALHWIWWLVGIGLLWLAWITARPAAHKLDSRIDAAIALAQECRGKEAQSELIALRATRATPAQLQRLQTALNEAASTCSRKLARDKAWADASNAIETALASSSVERARTRLAAFTRRWGDDEDTAAAKKRIDAAKAPPPSAPSAQSRDSASNLMTEAERDIARGNYKGAVDKMDACVAMVDAANRDCIALRAKAQRLYQGL